MTASKLDVKASILAELAWDNRVNAADIEVDVYDGTVQLKGSVPTISARNAAEVDAWVVEGVSDVENKIAVEYPTTFEVPEDEKIMRNVVSSLMANIVVDSPKIDVKVDGGIVTLSGTQDTYYKKLKAETIASEISGVLTVTNNIAVVPTEDVIDEDIATDITDKLERSLYVNPDNVDVEVNDGAVHLSGVVNDWNAYNVTMDAARYTAGVIDIIDDLVINR